MSYGEEHSFLSCCMLFLVIHPQICTRYKEEGRFLFRNVDGLPLVSIYRDVLKSGPKHYTSLISINYLFDHINHQILLVGQNSFGSIPRIYLKDQAFERNKIMNL